MEALKLIPDCQKSTIITNKDYINHFRSSEPKRDVLFTDFIELTVEKKRKRSTESYQMQYATIVAHLKNFCEENN